MSARSSARARRGMLALKLALVCGFVTLAGAGLTLVLVVQTMSAALPAGSQDVLTRGWILGAIIAVLAALGVTITAYVQGSSIAQRLTDLAIAVNKLGRGSSEVRVRVGGNDEVAALGRSLQYVASDLAAMFKEQEQAGQLGAIFDPQVRELRDRTLPQSLPAVAGFEVDGALSAGSRGGLDYFDAVTQDGGAILFLVSAEGAGAMAILACRMARDELLRAFGAGANARKALSHTNRMLHKTLPRGVCAKAMLLELAADEVKLYQAGYAVPCLVCARGELEQVTAEGLALGLDEGPVFEKGLRSTKIPVAPGVRMVLINEAGYRIAELSELVRTHSPKHTAPFMNMVLGSLESTAGGEGLREDVVLLTAKRS